MAEPDLRVAAFPKLDASQMERLSRCAEATLERHAAGRKLRSGFVKRVASAVGEGSISISFVHRVINE